MNIYNHREIIGQANTAKQAERIIKRLVRINKGWKVSVHQRDTTIIDLPAGWVFSIHP